MRTRMIVVVTASLLCVSAIHAQAPAPSEPITLKRAVALAVENSRDLALARIRFNISEKTAGVNRALFRPNFYSGSGMAYTRGFPDTPYGAPTIFNLSYVQTIFNSPLRGELRASEERIKAQQLTVERMRDTVMLNAASAYLELTKVRHSLALLRNERSSTQKILEVTRQRASEGLELPIEVTRAQLSMARTEQRIVQHEGREDTLENQLRNLMGLPPDQRVEVSDSDAELSLGPEQPAGELITLAMTNSLELKEAELERSARELRLKGERGGRWPSLELVGKYGLYSKVNNFEDFYRKFERNSFSFGVSIKFPVFSARTSAAVGLAQSQLNAAETELKNKRVDIETSVRQEARHRRELEATREVARLELQLSQENLRVLLAQFEEGRLNLRDLEKARLEESDKWMAFLDADYQRQRSHLELLKATGQLARVLQ